MPEHEEDYQERSREMEATARRMEERRERFGQEVDEAESDWEGKESDEGVPGAQDEEQKLVVDDEVKERVIAEQEQGEGGAEAEEAGAEGEPEREDGEEEGAGGTEASSGDEDDDE